MEKIIELKSDVLDCCEALRSCNLNVIECSDSELYLALLLFGVRISDDVNSAPLTNIEVVEVTEDERRALACRCALGKVVRHHVGLIIGIAVDDVRCHVGDNEAASVGSLLCAL